MRNKSKELNSALPPQAGETIRVGALDTRAAVRKELGRLYRAIRKALGPSPTPADGTKLAYILSAISKSLDGEEIEKRLEEIERRLNEQGNQGSPG